MRLAREGALTGARSELLTLVRMINDLDATLAHQERKKIESKCQKPAEAHV